LSSNRLRELYNRYRSTHPRPERVADNFCRESRRFFESENIGSETYETQVRRLHEHCEQHIEASLVARAVGCSVSYARRFSYDPSRGAFEKEWSKSTQREKVSPGTRTRIIDRDAGTCLRCSMDDKDELEVHHILPVSQGGTNEDSNLATLCSQYHQAAHGGSKTSGRIAYAVADFRDWARRADYAPEERSNSAEPRQKRMSDY